MASSQIGRINSKTPPGTSAISPMPWVTSRRLNMSRTQPGQERGVADEAEDGDRAWDQAGAVEQDGHAQSARATDQVDHQDGDAVLGVQQRAETHRR